MNLEFDENKNKFNKSKHGLSMERALEFEWETANYKVDDRKDYEKEKNR